MDATDHRKAPVWIVIPKAASNFVLHRLARAYQAVVAADFRRLMVGIFKSNRHVIPGFGGAAVQAWVIMPDHGPVPIQDLDIKHAVFIGTFAPDAIFFFARVALGFPIKGPAGKCRIRVGARALRKFQATVIRTDAVNTFADLSTCNRVTADRQARLAGLAGAAADIAGVIRAAAARAVDGGKQNEDRGQEHERQVSE